MGAVIEFIINLLMELVLWLMELFAKSLESMCSIKGNFMDSFSESLLGSDGLYVSKSGSALFPAGSDPLLVMQTAGLCMLIVFTTWSLVKAMFGNLARAESPQKILTDTFIYGIMIVSYSLWVNAFLSVGFAPIYQEVEGATGLDVDWSSMLTTSAAALGVEVGLEFLTGGLLTPVFLGASVLMCLLKLIFFFSLLGKFVELILEVVERFLQIFFVTIFGPLCIACGTSSSLARVAGTWFRIWINNYVLFILNMFFVKLSLVAMGNLVNKCANVFTSAQAALENGQLFIVVGLWLMTYCTIRVGTKTDQIMRSLGFDVLQADGQILNPLTQGVIGSIIGNVVAGTIEKNSGKIAEGAKKGFLGAWGLANKTSLASTLNKFSGKTSGKTDASAKAKEKLAKVASGHISNISKENDLLRQATLKNDMNGKNSISSVFGKDYMDNESIERTLNEAADIAQKRAEKGVESAALLGTGSFDKKSLAKLNDYLKSKGMTGDMISAKMENGDLKFLVCDENGNESYCQLSRLEQGETVSGNTFAIGDGAWELTEKPAVKNTEGAGVTKDIIGDRTTTMADAAVDTGNGYVTSEYTGETPVEATDGEGYAIYKDGKGVARLRTVETDGNGNPISFEELDADGFTVMDEYGSPKQHNLSEFITGADGKIAKYNVNGRGLAYEKADGTMGYMDPTDDLPDDFKALKLDNGAPLSVSKIVGINVAMASGKPVKSTFVPRSEQDAAANLVSVYGTEDGDNKNTYAAIDTKASRLAVQGKFRNAPASGSDRAQIKTKAGYLVPEESSSGYIYKTENENGRTTTKVRVHTAGAPGSMFFKLNGKDISVQDAISQSNGALESDNHGHIWATMEKGSFATQTVATVGRGGRLTVAGKGGKNITLDPGFAVGNTWSEIVTNADGKVEVNENGVKHNIAPMDIRSAAEGGVQRYRYDNLSGSYTPDNSGDYISVKVSDSGYSYYQTSLNNFVTKTVVRDFTAINTVGDVVTNNAGVVEFDTAAPVQTGRNGVNTLTSSSGQTFYNKKGAWISSANGTGGPDGMTEFRTEGTYGIAYTTAVAENVVDKHIASLAPKQAKGYFSSLYSADSHQEISSVDMSRAKYGIYSARVTDGNIGSAREVLILSQNSYMIKKDQNGDIILPQGVKGVEKTLDSGLKVLEIDQAASNADTVARFVNDAKRDFKGFINIIQDKI